MDEQDYAIPNGMRKTGLMRVGRWWTEGTNDTAIVDMATTPTAAQYGALERLANGSMNLQMIALGVRTKAVPDGPELSYKGVDVSQQVWAANRGMSRNMIGSAVRDMVREAQEADINFLPMDKDSRPVETDKEAFMAKLIAAMQEVPKVTGKPELANPMDTENNRRLMDLVDQMNKEANRPELQTESEWVADAKKLLRKTGARAELETKMGNGDMLDPVQTIAAKQVLRERGDKFYADPSTSNMMDMVNLGIGWRDGGTEQARAMRARYDQIKKPSERIKEFVTGAMATLPDTIARQVRILKEQGKNEQAKKLIQKHGQKAVMLVAKWKKDGIDLSVLDDAKAADPRLLARIDRDIRTLYPQGAWDVIHEIRRNNLMYAPKTWVRNALGGFYAVADTFITKPVARIIRGLIDQSGARGETAASWHAFGSEMVVGKAIQNAALSMVYEVPALETQIRAATGAKLLGSLEAEQHAAPAITGDTMQAAIEAATSVLTGEGMVATRAGKAAKVLGKRLGQAQRIPQRINMAMDEIVKTMHLYSEVAAWAVRIGKQAGLEVGTPEMQKFVDEQLNDMGSTAFQQAVASGESWRVAFQGDAGRFEQFILNATSAKFGAVGQVLRLMIPFRKTPIQLAGQALMHVPGIGVGRMVHRAMQARAGAKPYTREQMSVHGAQQVIGMIGTALVWGLVGGEDDEDAVILTGPASYARRARQERVTTQQVQPYMSFKIGGKWRNYNYVEPFSQWLGTVVAFVEEAKRMKEKGVDRPSKNAMRVWHKLSGMYSDQTYIRTVGDLMKAYQDPEVYGQRLAVNFAGSWLPNLVDDAIRDADPYIRERRIMGVAGERATMAKRVQREMFPVKNIMPPPKIDFFGNEITVPNQLESPQSMFMVRLLSPIQPRYVVKGKQADIIRMLMQYNEGREVGHPDPTKRPTWFQEPYRKVSVQYRGMPKKVQEDMNENEYYLYSKLSGLLAAKIIEQRTWNTSNPTQRDILLLEQIFAKSRSQARKFVQGAHQAKAVGNMKAYQNYMNQLRERVSQLSSEE